MAVAAVLLTAIPLPSQAPSPVPPSAPRTLPGFYRNLIVLDPAHGGRDHGAQLSSSAVEKDVTLAFAQRLRPALVAQGFTVVSTRDSDPPDELTSDQRAGTANHVRPLACIVLHAAPAGSGVHIVSSSLPAPETGASRRALVWNKAQAPTVPMSLRLANEIGLAVDAAHLPVLLMRASIPPIDNLICPAIAIELAPLKGSSTNVTFANDAGYQQRAVNAIAAGLASFRTHNAPPPTTPPGTAPRTGATP
ncbi:MAG TPA: N-acetylmuramoyl-L-alanine amidase [Vicinamibacterales bacterium]|nr:N-acetylmuramoyl-L-alanine amidase [Vicinamibacterales bacterium]